jgi:hypothetical protein
MTYQVVPLPTTVMEIPWSGGESESKAQTKLQTVCYGDIDLFLLRNPDNPERDILMAEVEFRNLKGRPEGADG